MSRCMLLCAALLAVTISGVSVQGQISAASQVLPECTLGGTDTADTNIIRLSVCVVGIKTVLKLTNDTGALFSLKKAVDNVMQQGADKFDTCSLFSSGDSTQNVINVQGYDSIVASIELTTTGPIIDPVSTIATKIQPTDGSNKKVTFLYQNSYLYPTTTSNEYKLDTAVTFEICPATGSYELFINVWSLLDECLVAFKLNVQVGPLNAFCPLGFPLITV